MKGIKMAVTGLSKYSLSTGQKNVDEANSLYNGPISDNSFKTANKSLTDKYKANPGSFQANYDPNSVRGTITNPATFDEYQAAGAGGLGDGVDKGYTYVNAEGKTMQTGALADFEVDPLTGKEISTNKDGGTTFGISNDSISTGVAALNAGVGLASLLDNRKLRKKQIEGLDENIAGAKAERAALNKYRLAYGAGA